MLVEWTAGGIVLLHMGVMRHHWLLEAAELVRLQSHIRQHHL